MSKDTIKVNMNVYDIPIVVEQLKKLEQENKQLKELKYKFFDNCGEEESFTLEDYLEIGNKLYDYEQENKQLNEENKQLKIENAYYKSKILGGNSQLQELNDKIEILGDKENERNNI